MEGYSITGSPGKLDICRNLYYYLPQISIMARFVQNLIRNPEIFRTLPYLELEEYSESCQASTSSIFQESCVTLAYLESWYIQNLRNIQNPVKQLWCNVFFNEPWLIYDEVFYLEPYANITFIDSWCILNVSIFRTRDTQDTVNL